MQLQKLPSIWTESPLTIPYISKGATIDRSNRFEINSIYHRDDPTKPKKQLDQLLFPMKLLQQFRKSIREAGSKSNEKLSPRRSASPEEEGRSMVLGQKVSRITKRLYCKPVPMMGQRDMFGGRCSMGLKQFEQVCKVPPSQPTLHHTKSNQKVYISSSQRVNLSRPINFNPGPGQYLKQTISPLLDRSTISISNNEGSSVLRRRPRERLLLSSIESSAKTSIH